MLHAATGFVEVGDATSQTLIVEYFREGWLTRFQVAGPSLIDINNDVHFNAFIHGPTPVTTPNNALTCYSFCLPKIAWPGDTQIIIDTREKGTRSFFDASLFIEFLS